MSSVVYITISYIFGIIAERTLRMPLVLVFCIALILFLVSLNLISKDKPLKSILFLLIFFLGMSNYALRMLPPSSIDFSNFINNETAGLKGVIVDEPRSRKDNLSFVLKVETLNSMTAKGKVSVLLKSPACNLKYGDKILIEGVLSEFVDNANPGLSSYAEYLENKGIRARLYASRSPEVISGGHGNILKRISFALRGRLKDIPSKILPKPYSELISSIIFGSKASPPPEDMKETYRRAGTIHLLVASGLHLSILIGCVMGIFRFLNLPQKGGAIAATVFGLIYAVMAGLGASIVRAFIMSELTLLALVLEREKDALNSLSIAALILLIVNPGSLFEIGFQLSFAATAGLLFVAPVFEEAMKGKIPRYLLVPISISLAPFLLTMPIIAYHFSQVSLVAVLTNALIISWVGYAVILGFACVILGAIFLPLAFIFSGALFFMLKALNFVVYGLGGLPFACIYIKPPTLVLIFGYYMVLAGIIYIMKNRMTFKFNKNKLVIIFLIFLSIVVWHSATSGMGGLTGKILEITVIDVGQGDSILIETPSGKKVLVDGGEEYAGKKIVVPFLRRKGINSLNMVILTHPHGDHVAGLPEVLKSFKVDSVFDAGIPHTSSYYENFLKLIEENKIKYKAARLGDILDFQDGVKASIYAPSEPLLEGTNSDLNNNSIVMRLTYGKFSILLTGDMESEGEERLIEKGAYLKSSILKPGHHGSNTSSSTDFLAKVQPEVAVISVGADNKFGHPGRKTLERLKEYNIQVLRTDKDGAIVIRTNGEKYIINKTRI